MRMHARACAIERPMHHACTPNRNVRWSQNDLLVSVDTAVAYGTRVEKNQQSLHPPLRGAVQW